MFSLKDRQGKELGLGPTHEEVITQIISQTIHSYKQLPINIFQIQTKFRDEIRPRFGLMRAREFIMKDAYSFDVSDGDALVSYQKMYDAYVRIFDRCGLHAFPVEADTGVMGGSHSHEFMVPAENGESEVVYTEDGSYSANLEKAVSSGPCSSTPNKCTGSPEEFETPGVKTIEDLTKPPFNVPAMLQIKTLVFITEKEPVIVLLRGDDEVNEAKLAVAFGTPIYRTAEPDEIKDVLGASPGSLGPLGIKGVKVFADNQLEEAAGMVTGANKDGFHKRNINVKRDLQGLVFSDLRTVREGELTSDGQPVKIKRSIEVGHVFKLGTKYCKALDASFLDESGKKQFPVMGCYGLGVTRTLQAIIECSHDENGIMWPMAIAPWQICITALDIEPDGPVMKSAGEIYGQLLDLGFDVILDDRDLRPGIKFKDSELIGFPLRVGMGSKSLKDGNVEIFVRASGEKITVPVDQAASRIKAILA